MPQRHLVILAKTPVIGRAKRRLAQDIGPVAAWQFAIKTATRVSRPLVGDARWQTWLALTPDRDAAQPLHFWPRPAKSIPQGPGDLGQRMGRLLETLPPGPALIIGTDIPAIRPHHIWRAFRALGRAAYVFGPTTDGGFWLVGAKRTPTGRMGLGNRLFNGVRWSTDHALDDTLRNIWVGNRVAFVDTLEDIDDGDAYRRQIKSI